MYLQRMQAPRRYRLYAETVPYMHEASRRKYMYEFSAQLFASSLGLTTFMTKISDHHPFCATTALFVLGIIAMSIFNEAAAIVNPASGVVFDFVVGTVCLNVCVRPCVRVCVYACVRVYVCICVHLYACVQPTCTRGSKSLSIMASASGEVSRYQ